MHGILKGVMWYEKYPDNGGCCKKDYVLGTEEWNISP
jgi:hypothetical protein